MWRTANDHILTSVLNQRGRASPALALSRLELQVGS